jgi:hypothetical protein
MLFGNTGALFALLSDWITLSSGCVYMCVCGGFYSRQNSFDVEVHEVQVDPFAGFAFEKVVALGVPGVEARVVGRREAAVGAVRTVERKRARVFHQLTTACHAKICRHKRRSAHARFNARIGRERNVLFQRQRAPALINQQTMCVFAWKFVSNENK